MNEFLWGVYPYLCITLFFVVPIIRMRMRPFSWSTRSSSLFNRLSLGVASLLMHWGLILVLIGHLFGLFGGVLGSGSAISSFYWLGLIGGCMLLMGAILALIRRLFMSRVRAMSQVDDYVVLLLLIPIVYLALYQVIAHRIFGVAYTASSWAASLWTLSPQPELMASASDITKLHIFLALTFFGYFPFTKLVHVWAFPINYFVRPYLSMRTQRFRFQRRWEFSMRSDKSWLVYGLGGVAVMFLASGSMLGEVSAFETTPVAAVTNGKLMGKALYVSQCARCHGLSGRGDGAGAASPTFGSPPRDLVTGAYRFVSSMSGVALNGDLRRAIQQGFPSSGMPAFDHLSGEQIESLLGVLIGLWVDRPETGESVEVPPRPQYSRDLIMRGHELFKTNCVSCHGENGLGDGPLAKTLDTQPRNLAGDELKAGKEPEQLYVRVAVGIPGMAMPMPRSLGVQDEETGKWTGLSPDDIWALVYYIKLRFLDSQ